jgi:hypothetical protein
MSDTSQEPFIDAAPALPDAETPAAEVAPPPPDDAGVSTDNPAEAAAAPVPLDEPAFPSHIRFEFGHAGEIEVWVKNWLKWKLGL